MISRENEFDKKLQRLIDNYCSACELYNIEYFENRAIAAINAAESNGKWAYWAAGRAASYILSQKDKFKTENLKYIVDSNSQLWGAEIEGILVVSPETLKKDSEIKTVIITAIEFADNIANDIAKLRDDILISNFHINKYSFCEKSLWFGLWSFELQTFDLKYKYNIENCNDTKKKHLEELVYIYLVNRDFISAFKYIDILILEYGAFKYEELKKLLENLLDEIREKLSSRKTKDVMMILCDTLGERHASNKELMPLLNKVREKSIVFTKAYSPSVHTRESLLGMFTQLTMEELNAVYNSDEHTKVDFPLVEYAKENDIEFNGYFGSINYVWVRNFYEKSSFFDKRGISDSSTKTLWSTITDLALSEKVQISLAHLLSETHYPFLSGDFDASYTDFHFTVTGDAEEKQRLLNIRYKECLSYLDKQMNFYCSMLSSSAYKIVFADHSTCLEEFFFEVDKVTKMGFHSDAIHVPLIIQGGGIKKMLIDDVYSTKGLFGLVQELLETGEISVPKNQVAEVGHFKFYDPVIRKEMEYKKKFEILNGFYLAVNDRYKLVIDSAEKVRCFDIQNGEEEIFDSELKSSVEKTLLKHAEGWSGELPKNDFTYL